MQDETIANVISLNRMSYTNGSHKIKISGMKCLRFTWEISSELINPAKIIICLKL